MKLTLLLCAFSMFACSYLGAQTVKTKDNVKLKSWGTKIMMFPPNYWDNKYEQVVPQIGAEEFEKVKAFSDYRSLPDQMSIFDGRKIRDTAAIYRKMDGLKMEHIATFTHYTRSGINRGQFAILRVPYSENSNWDSAAKWDTLYFIVSVSSIEKQD